MPEPEPKMTEEAQRAYDEALRRIKQWSDLGNPSYVLDLMGLGLTTLPHEIFQLTALKALDLAKNRLTALPPEIGKLSNLRKLNLWSNQLATLPQEIGMLQALIELNLYDNRLKALPPEIGQLRSLTEFYIRSNLLSALPPEIGQLTQLRVFSLPHNNVASLPPEIGNIKALTRLSVDVNKLREVPPEIGQLSELRGLGLGGNQLHKLPIELTKLGKLEWIYLHGNDDLRIPRELLGPSWGEVRDDKAQPRPPREILAYYFETQSQGTRPLNEVRLVLVGRGAAGKTSLVQRLVNDTFNPAQEETAGIALCDWPMRGCVGGPVTAHVWDFAGQVVTHSMHRYFLSHRTIYILVLTQREDSAGEDADYWLKLIQSYGTDKQDGGAAPPVIVALNKSDQAKVKVDRNFLLERFPFIIGFVETDCQSGGGIAELRDKLCALMDEPKVKAWVREGFPQQWWKVKEAILREQATRPHLSYDQWRKLCAESGETNEEKQDQLSQLLHTLGVALNYADDPRLHDNTVLRPNWVTGHCYNLIRHAAKQYGALHRAEVESVLRVEGEHDPRMHDYLMRLMERFQAAYPLGESYPPERWLVPLGLPDDQPDGLALFGQTAPEKAARLRYTYPSIPPGLIAQFIVRTHPLMEPKMQWASGTVLTLEGARALVRAVSKMEIEITAIGDDDNARRDLAGLCRDEINALNAQIAGLDVVERTEVVADGERVWVNVLSLRIDEFHWKKTSGVDSGSGTVEVDTKKVLDVFGTEEGRLPEEDFFSRAVRLAGGPKKEAIFKVGRGTKPKPRVFISYSHTDERHLKTLNLRLTILKNQGLLKKPWDDRRIQAGMDWDRKIQEEIAQADVVIFLTSNAALASDYINKDELRPALERHVKQEATVVFIILERCDWKDTFAKCPPLKKLKDPSKRVPKVLPENGKPIDSFDPRNDGWHQVTEGLKSLLTELKAKLE